jgi:tRNA (Thr-GGU) A37 N-methylase
MKAQKKNSIELCPIGVIRSKIKERSKAPKQGSEGAPDAWLEVHRLVLSNFREAEPIGPQPALFE